MKKLKLLGSGKSSHHNYFIFSKHQDFFEIARKLLDKLGFEEKEYGYLGRPLDKNHEPINNKDDDINKYTDVRYAYGEDCFVEIVFGKEKIFLLIHTKKDSQEIISAVLKELVEF